MARPHSSSRRAITCAWISTRPSKIDRMRASHSTREIGYSSAKPLPPWICRALSAAPRDPGGEELRHAGLEVAAPPLVLGAAGEIGELARDVDLGGHEGSLSATRGKATSGLPNWIRSSA